MDKERFYLVSQLAKEIFLKDKVGSHKGITLCFQMAKLFYEAQDLIKKEYMK